MNKYRITVKDKNIKLYINDNNSEIINLTNWLISTTTQKAFIFGKLEYEQQQSKIYWSDMKFYSKDILEPMLIQPISWKLVNRFINGSTVHSLNILNNNIIAIINPSVSIIETDDISDYVIKTYILDENNKWIYDSSYDIMYKNIVTNCVWNNYLYSSAYINEYFTGTTLQHDDIVYLVRRNLDNINSTDVIRKGNIITRRLTNAWDSIIKDTNAPETNVIINEDQAAGGLQIYELQVYSRDELLVGGGG